MAKKNAAGTTVELSVVKITKDIGKKLADMLKKYLEDPKRNTPTPIYFRLRRLVNDVKQKISADLEQAQVWEKSVASRRAEVMKRYADLMPSGELKEAPAGYSPEGLPLVKRTFATKEKELACQTELNELNATLSEEAKVIDEQFSAIIEISGHTFNQSEIPTDMSNAEKNILDSFTIEG